jgi:hypothetical protein
VLEHIRQHQRVRKGELLARFGRDGEREVGAILADLVSAAASSTPGASCQPKPTACDAIYQPVCACGGVTHANDCEAALADPEVALSSYRACP